MIKSIIRIVSISLIVIGVFAGGVVGSVYFGLSGISQSHTDGNIPAKELFASYLARDLTSYFDKKHKEKTHVEYKLLRNEPTQNGLSFPKYYTWITVTSLDKSIVLDSGAARIAAVDQEYFQVDDFISTVEIKRNPDSLNQIFPSDVVVKIKQEVTD
jgi:hypothetical protein